jgi:hypothetical protein
LSLQIALICPKFTIACEASMGISSLWSLWKLMEKSKYCILFRKIINTWICCFTDRGTHFHFLYKMNSKSIHINYVVRICSSTCCLLLAWIRIINLVSLSLIIDFRIVCFAFHLDWTKTWKQKRPPPYKFGWDLRSFICQWQCWTLPYSSNMFILMWVAGLSDHAMKEGRKLDAHF